MKICFLEVSPKGPLSGDHRDHIKDFFKDDYYFVTHDEKSQDKNFKEMNFNKGFVWAKNRNYLAKNVPRNYDYYWFSDYDVKYESKTNLSVCNQILKDLILKKPAVMVCHDESKIKSNNGGVKNNSSEKYKNIMMSNNQMKIIHRSLLDWFFPLPFHTGGKWDACHYFNVLETPFVESVICTYNVECKGLISEKRSAGGNMDKIHDELLPCFNNKTKKINLHKEFKNHYIGVANNSSIKKFDFDSYNLNNYFNIEKLKKIVGE